MPKVKIKIGELNVYNVIQVGSHLTVMLNLFFTMKNLSNNTENFYGFPVNIRSKPRVRLCYFVSFSIVLPELLS